MRFHYLPFSSVNTPRNVDSAEYANIVLSFVRFYDQARRAGMPALPAADVTLMHQWIERAHEQRGREDRDHREPEHAPDRRRRRLALRRGIVRESPVHLRALLQEGRIQA